VTEDRKGFQKRHLLSPTRGVVDAEYIRKTGDLLAVVGRKVRLDGAEVRALVATVLQAGRMLAASLAALEPDEKTPLLKAFGVNRLSCKSGVVARAVLPWSGCYLTLSI
jgi:hypothetical protein